MGGGSLGVGEVSSSAEGRAKVSLHQTVETTMTGANRLGYYCFFSALRLWFFSMRECAVSIS